jgi:hypothetical protein
MSFCIAGLVFGMSHRTLRHDNTDKTGFAALKPILLDSGVYSNLCDGGKTCKAQDTRLNFLFTVASSVTNVRPISPPKKPECKSEEDGGEEWLMIGLGAAYGCCPGPGRTSVDIHLWSSSVRGWMCDILSWCRWGM